MHITCLDRSSFPLLFLSGPAVTGAVSNYFGTGLWNRLSSSFGYLTTSGYTYNGQTKRFPIAIGESGSKFQDPRDLQFMPDFQTYLTNTGAANDGRHTPITSFFFWSWNDNSGDTGEGGGLIIMVGQGGGGTPAMLGLFFKSNLICIRQLKQTMLAFSEGCLAFDSKVPSVDKSLPCFLIALPQKEA